MIKGKRFIGQDLDGTTAFQEDPYDPDRIGPPIPKMLIRLRRELKKGYVIWILTARVSTHVHSPAEIKKRKRMIERYCVKWLGQKLVVTAEKHPQMDEIRDDRARQVRFNKGTFVTQEIIHAVRSSWGKS